MNKTARSVAITGGAGRVGRLVAEDLVNDGMVVKIMDLPGVNYEGLEGQPGHEILPGDIGDIDYLRASFAGCEAVVHLAAVLPPVADDNPDLAERVNVGGTENVLAAMQAVAPNAHLVFGSSVVVYGNTQGSEPPVGIETDVNGIGAYAQSKMESERLIREAGLASTVLRISGVSVADFLMPPDVWPFTAEQRMEFVLREDVAKAAAAAVRAPGAVGRVLNVAGGGTWRMTGQEYSDAYFGAFELPLEEASFIEQSTAFDFYDTTATEKELGLATTPFSDFVAGVEEAIRRALEE
ncbi:MAG TPA: NAD(P)-dependent oxidoreductase [Chloroflexota bacterium]|nr:NAD(P)-dependent oxidoreductase [Chloroflexota bacterium]